MDWWARSNMLMGLALTCGSDPSVSCICLQPLNNHWWHKWIVASILFSWRREINEIRLLILLRPFSMFSTKRSNLWPVFQVVVVLVLFVKRYKYLSLYVRYCSTQYTQSFGLPSLLFHSQIYFCAPKCHFPLPPYQVMHCASWSLCHTCMILLFFLSNTICHF